MALAKLCTTVAKLTKQSYGYQQLSRQYLVHDTDNVHPVGGTDIFDLCSEQPVCWCHQAITEGTQLELDLAVQVQLSSLWAKKTRWCGCAT